MTGPDSPLARLEEVATRPDDAGLRWLTAPHGLLAACRQAVAEDRITDLVALVDDDLVDELDDRSAVRPGPAPSVLARALVAAATAAAEGAPDPPADVIAAYGPVGASDLAAYLRGETLPATARAAIGVVLSRHRDGELATLHLEQRAGSPGLAIDAVRAPFLRVDDTFRAALGDAATAAGTADRSVRWSLTSVRTGDVPDVVSGPSIGLGAGLAFRRLRDDDAAPADPSWTFTGALDERGRVQSLLDEDRNLNDYRAKLRVSAGRTVVLPSVDHGYVAPAVEASDTAPRLVPVSTLDQAEEILERHLAGRASYEDALAGREGRAPGAHRRRGLLVGVLSGLVLVAVTIGVLQAVRAADRRADAEEARDTARGTLVAVTPDDAPPFRIQRTEVSNEEYSRCVDAGRCTPPDRDTQGQPVTDEQVANLPVARVDLLQANAFCEWIGGQLPSLAEWQSAVVEVGGESWPATAFDGEVPAPPIPIPPSYPEWDGVPGDVDDGGNVKPLDRTVHLADNALEWSRTLCESDGGGELGADRTDATCALGLGLVPGDQPGQGTTEWWAGFLLDPDTVDIGLGFRCVVAEDMEG